MIQVLVCVPVREAHRQKMQQALPDARFTYVLRENLTKADVADAEVIFGNLDPALLPEAPNLKLLQLNSAGADPYSGKIPPGVTMITATGAYGLTVSEHLLTMLLCVNRRFPQYVCNQQTHLWQLAGEVKSVTGSTILILGMGDIGGQFAAKVKALGAYTIGIRRQVGEIPAFLDEQYPLGALEELLPRADVVTICLPATRETYHLFNAHTLALMKPDAILMNVGRGSIIDTEALIQALQSKRIGCACLDVTDPEPLPVDHPLWSLDNVLITPHAAGGFLLPSTLDRVVDIACENMVRYVREIR